MQRHIIRLSACCAHLWTATVRSKSKHPTISDGPTLPQHSEPIIQPYAKHHIFSEAPPRHGIGGSYLAKQCLYAAPRRGV
ncbi:hypothetical protein AFLA_013710 [Aspergillus flavus NRRL3357]|nr:hypothetical protein AFLA_013710 [Aspergillus flavus NRRL3357]